MSIDEKIIISAEAEIAPEDVSESFIRSSGPGGQNVNKVNSKAVLRFPISTSPSIPEGVRMRQRGELMFLFNYGDTPSTLPTEPLDWLIGSATVPPQGVCVARWPSD